MIPIATEEFLALNHRFSERVEGHREDIQRRSLEYLEARSEGRVIDFEYADSLEKLCSQITADHGLSLVELNTAIAQRMADLVVNEYVKECIERTSIGAMPTIAAFPPLPPQTVEDRRTFMVAGGIASGKGTTEQEIIDRALGEGVDWGHVMCWNNDALKAMLLDPDALGGDAIYFSALTYDEAYVIRDMVFADYRARLETNTAPHLYIDQTLPKEEIFELAGSPKGRGLDLTVVQMPVERSFQLAYKRGVETKRFETTSGIINTHAGAPKQLLQSLEYAQDKGLMNVRVHLVANISRGVVAPLARFDFSKREGEILDLGGCREFFRKTTLNSSARRFEDLYPEGPTPPEKYDSHIKRLAQFIGVPVPVFQAGVKVGILGDVT